jgi:hypothetical protein
VGPEFVFRVETNLFRKRLFSFQKQTFLKNIFLFVFRHTDNPGGKLLFSSRKLTFRNFCFRVKKRLFSIVLVVLGHSLGTGLATHNSKRLRHAHRHRRIRQRHIRHRHIRPRHSPPAPPRANRPRHTYFPSASPLTSLATHIVVCCSLLVLLCLLLLLPLPLHTFSKKGLIWGAKYVFFAEYLCFPLETFGSFTQQHIPQEEQCKQLSSEG